MERVIRELNGFIRELNGFIRELKHVIRDLKHPICQLPVLFIPFPHQSSIICLFLENKIIIVLSKLEEQNL